MWNQTQLEQLKKAIRQAEIISFDVFDTLIVRLVNTPEDVFSLLERKLGIRGLAAWRRDCQMMASQQAEQDGHKAHADLEDIYACLAKVHGPVTDWDAAKAQEIAIERQVLRRNREVYEVYQYARSLGKRIIVTSDMYLDQATVQSLVEDLGYHHFDTFYVSAAANHTKFRGDIYPYIAGKEGVKPNRILHIGDNERSDVELAQKAGWNAFLYVRNSIPNEETIRHTGIFDLGVGRYVQTGAFWHDLGAYVGGPLYVGIVQWLKAIRQSNPERPIFFLARDGYNLFQLSRQESWPDCHYLYASRRAMILAGITELDEDALALLPPYTMGQTIEDVIRYIELEGVTEEQLTEIGFSGYEDKIETLKDMERFKQLYVMNETAFLEQCRQEREQAKRYLEEIGFLQTDSIVFDCGWNGSSQYLLNRLLREIGYAKDNRFVYIGILGTVKSRRQLKNADYTTYLFDIDHNESIQGELAPVIALFELFFGAPQESLLKYGAHSLVFEALGNDEQYKSELCQGIIDFVSAAQPLYEEYKISNEANVCLEGFRRLINHPSEQEAVTIGDIPEVDGAVAQGNIRKYLARLDYETYRENPNIEIYWKTGLLARPDLDPRLKRLLTETADAADKPKAAARAKRTAHPLPGKRAFVYWKNRLKYGKRVADYSLQCEKLESLDLYQKWIRKYEPALWTTEEVPHDILFSVVVPVYNVLRQQLTECIESILHQTYDRFELILVDDCSTWEEVRDVLAQYEGHEKVKVIYRTQNGHISACTNTGIAEAQGDYLVFSDCDDVLSNHALYEVAAALSKNPQLDFIYSDEDKLAEDGSERHLPFFKPDWSPDAFLSQMYTNHLGIYRTELVRKTGGLRSKYDGTQDYDFTLRFLELSSNDRVGHIPKILYHWREREGSIASNPEAKPYALEVMRQMKEEMLARRGIDASVEYVPDLFQYRIVYHAPQDVLTSIIIPSKDNPEALMRCIDSIRHYTRCRCEILVVDNGSTPQNKARIAAYLTDRNAMYLYQPMDFNFSAMCNIGAKQAKGDLLLFLNDDTEVFRYEWLERMAGHAWQDHTGAVGAKLLYPDSNIIQHIGITNLEIGPSHSLIGFPDNNIYYFGRNKIEYNWLAVTAACLMIRKDKFDQVDGFDEDFPVAYNDVELCFRLAKQGWYQVVHEDVTLYHHESLSRGSDDEDEEKQQRLLADRARLYQKHPCFDRNDPYYNRNLTPDRVNYEMRNYEFVIHYAAAETIDRYPVEYESNYIVMIDNLMVVDGRFFIRGWYATWNPRRDNNSDVYVWLRNEDNLYLRAKADKEMRRDVEDNLQTPTCYVGFCCHLHEQDIPKGPHQWQVGLQVRGDRHQPWRIKWMDRFTLQ